MRRLALSLLATATCLWAHGGVLLLHERAGQFLVSLFSADAPLRAGAQNFTVLVQDAADASPVLDRQVTLTFRQPGGPEIKIPATAGLAANHLLYAAPAQLSTGSWQVVITIRSPGGAVVAAHGALTILPPQPPLAAYWPYFAVPPIVVGLFILNRWLKLRSKAARV